MPAERIRSASTKVGDFTFLKAVSCQLVADSQSRGRGRNPSYEARAVNIYFQIAKERTPAQCSTGSL